MSESNLISINDVHYAVKTLENMNIDPILFSEVEQPFSDSETVSTEDYIANFRWGSPENALGATLVLKQLSKLDGRILSSDEITIVFGDYYKETLAINSELLVVLGDLHVPKYINMSFVGAGMGEIFVAGSIITSVIRSDESIFVAGNIEAGLIAGFYNDGSMYVLGSIKALALISKDHAIFSQGDDEIEVCLDTDRNRWESHLLGNHIAKEFLVESAQEVDVDLPKLIKALNENKPVFIRRVA